MAKEVTKENLKDFASCELQSVANLVEAGMLKGENAKGRVDELFFLSATFGLDLNERAREIKRDLKERLQK